MNLPFEEMMQRLFVAIAEVGLSSSELNERITKAILASPPNSLARSRAAMKAMCELNEHMIQAGLKVDRNLDRGAVMGIWKIMMEEGMKNPPPELLRLLQVH